MFLRFCVRTPETFEVGTAELSLAQILQSTRPHVRSTECANIRMQHKGKREPCASPYLRGEAGVVTSWDRTAVERSFMIPKAERITPLVDI